ncbi:MAG: hypothetical protein ACOYBY_11445 [Dermatophilaceae bacterium]
MNDAGAVTGGLIGLVWLLIGWWMIRTGTRRTLAAQGWRRTVATLVDREGGTAGVLLRHPYLRYAGSDGAVRVVASRSRGGVWEPGTSTDILVDPHEPERVMLLTHAERGQPYLVIGWFLVIVAVLTFVGSVLLVVAVPR